MAKTARAKLQDKADKLAGDAVRARGRCELAGKDKVTCNGTLQWAHIVGRANRRLRWEAYNALCLCAGHHIYYTHHPWEWYEIIRAQFPLAYGQIQEHRQETWDKNIEVIIERYAK